MKVKVYLKKDGEGYVETKNPRYIRDGKRELQDHQAVVSVTSCSYPVDCVAIGDMIVVRDN